MVNVSKVGPNRKSLQNSAVRLDKHWSRESLDSSSREKNVIWMLTPQPEEGGTMTWSVFIKGE